MEMAGFLYFIEGKGFVMVNPFEQERDCFICRKHRGEIEISGGAIYEDELLYVGHISSDSGEAYLGYLIVDLKRHVPGLAELQDDESAAVGRMLTRVSRALKACVGAEHIYSFVLGDHVPHLHIHLIPRYPNTPSSFWGFKISGWPDAPRGDASQIEEVCSRIRKFMRGDEAADKAP
jgi:histidine triad (HIT) family protein